MTLFNSGNTEVRYQVSPVSIVQDLDVETYCPDHGTPLYDAIGRTLSAAKQEAPADARKLCVILTDGEENASEEYTRTKIFALIKACEKQGWPFLYLGADHDVWAAGESLGIVGENRISFDKRNSGTHSDSSRNRPRATADESSRIRGRFGRRSRPISPKHATRGADRLITDEQLASLVFRSAN